MGKLTRTAGTGLGICLGIGLAVWIGVQLGDQALAVIVGVVFGVIAGIPTSLLLLLVMARYDTRKREKQNAVVVYRKDNYPLTGRITSDIIGSSAQENT